MPAHVFHVSSIDFGPTQMSPAELLQRIATRGHWPEASIHPSEQDFPRLGVEHHPRAGFSILVHQNESAIGSLATTGQPLGAPAVAVNLGGQVIERWSRELFLPEIAALEVVGHFFATGRQHPDYTWIRLDCIPREHLYEGRGLLEYWDELKRRGEA